MGTRLLFVIALVSTSAAAQQPPSRAATEQDHRNMMEQLGIRALRPGPSGNESAPNHANYDESLANPYPNVPDVLTTKRGRKVTTADEWWAVRRPEIVEDMEREVYGRLPRDIPKVTWTTVATDTEVVGRTPVIAKQLVGRVDNTSYPAISIDIAMTVVVPASAKGPAPDAKHVGIEGVSRYGKAALVTLAFEPRFAMGLIGSSGKGGAPLHRRNWGEAVENLAGASEYHWMAGNYLKYGASDATFGAKTANDLPVDSHELIALCAPRLTFISYGVPEKGDAKWLDHQGSYMAAIAAGPVFKLLGARDLGVSNDYKTEKMPPVNTGLLDGELAWRQHDGGHTDAPNVRYFVQWADRLMKRGVAAGQ